MQQQVFITNKELRKALVIFLAMCGLAHYRRKEMQKRWLAPEQKPRWMDHPIVPYILENASLFGVIYGVLRVAPKLDQTRPLRTFAATMFSTMIVVEPLLLLLRVCAEQIYTHVPWFSPREVPSDLYTFTRNHLICTIPAGMIESVLVAGAISHMPLENFNVNVVNPAPLRVFPFLAKFLFCRVVVDIVFGYVHYALHAYPTLYNLIHKRHHEHTTPRTPTNHHFNFVDLFMEALFPLNIAFGALEGLGMPLNHLEQVCILVPLVYFESGSHTGKEIPNVTWFPMLSPLVDWITGSDQRLIEYHTRHHQLFRCNYSISPWVDKLWGTYRIDPPNGGGVKYEEGE